VPDKIKLIAGLGNPGPEYQATRHNAGFWLLDRLASHYTCQFSKESKFFAESARIQSGSVNCRLLKPTTFMNESGRAVAAILNYYDIAPEEVLVAHDEIDFEPGKVRLKFGGGHAGHNGLRNIIAAIGSKNFYRIRIGVGHPGQKDKVIGSVLGRPSSADEKLIQSSIDLALDILPLVFSGEMEKAMHQLHTED
jgi:PTH1 family peptidyl-tRNA hydrolase